ncbi:hypothetical protein F4777DRAFT_579667 [Nemania sp. FL0916]|nr:hypothetical protein F4777DRAFT_579667 [Nemania sp. FL0916]
MAQGDSNSSQTHGLWPRSGASESPENAKNTPTYAVFNNQTAQESSNGANIPPAGAKEAPSRPAMPSFKEGVQSIKPGDFFSIHRLPCAREGFLTGIGAATVIGAGRYVVGGKAFKAANWAVGSFMLGSVIQWEVCQAQRRRERAAMARAVEIMDHKQAEQKKADEDARLKREAEEKAREAQKRWYKFW